MIPFGSTPSPREKLEHWLEEALEPTGRLPFSFRYGGSPSAGLLRTCAFTKEVRALDAGADRITAAYQLADGLQATVQCTYYKDTPAVEWSLSFRNNGGKNSAVLEHVKPLDLGVEYSPFRTAGTQQYGAHDNILYYSGGSDCKADDFLPLQEILHYISNKGSMHFGSLNGRPTSGSHGCFPYFNLKTQDCGVILALAWGGQWELDLQLQAREPGSSAACFRFSGGMPGTRLFLLPGEKISTPRVLVMPWSGEVDDAQNSFRRHMLRRHHPHIDGRPVRLPVSATCWGTDEQDHLRQLELIERSGLPVDAYWIDAGWYGKPGTHCNEQTSNDWSDNVGYHEHDPLRYPDGLRPVSDRARALGMKFLLWFEHERAVYGTPATLEHPEFFLGERKKGAHLILNLGDPKAWQWMFNNISTKITDYGIDILRVDHNVDPLAAWEANDPPGRHGITQIRCVEGFYRLWDALLERHPGLVIDNCASGGRRLEFEAMGRSVALFRTDYSCYTDNSPTGHQMMTCGLGKWVPVSSPGGSFSDRYTFRSMMNQGISISVGEIEAALNDPDRLAELRAMFAELERVRDLYAADLYPLTNVTVCNRDWLAYELCDPAKNRAAVVCFRREECPFEASRFRLKGLRPASAYRVEDASSGETVVRTGRSLMEEGLPVTLGQPRSSALLYIDPDASL